MSDFLLSLKDVSLAFGGPQVLDRVSLSIHKGLRAALTGRNGEGKSTLMKVIAGTLEPDTGEIVRAPGLKVVYVGQGVEEKELEVGKKFESEVVVVQRYLRSCAYGLQNGRKCSTVRLRLLTTSEE